MRPGQPGDKIDGMRSPRVGAIALCALGALVLLGWGIDSPLLTHVQRLWPGMAPVTALSLALLSGALLTSRRPSAAVPQALSVTAAVIGGVGVMRFFYDSPMSIYAPMALHTALGVMVAAMAILATRPDASLLRMLRDPGPGGVMARALLPVAMGSPLISGWVLLNIKLDVRTHVHVLAPLNALVFGGLVWWVAHRLRASDVLHRADVSARHRAEQARAEQHERFLLLTRATLDSDRISMEHQLRDRTAELERSNSDLERFAQIASHDLQEPLRTISSFVQLIAKRYGDKLDDNGARYIHYAVDGAERMRGLINALLAYSRVDRLDAPINAEVSLAEVVARVRADLRTAIAESHAELTCDELPVVQGNEIQLTQVLLNVISNAVKYRGSEAPRIHIAATREEPGWKISVRDNGIGIDPRYFERIFIVFQRLHTREAYEGTGVGLAICKRIVERHGGRIWVESEPGTGSTFHFTLKPSEGEAHVEPLA
jgi:signal transduction histidine kinase